MSLTLMLMMAVQSGPQSNAADAEERPTPIASATQIPSGVARVDGRLDEAWWRNAVFLTDFQQKEPVEGGTPSVQTAVSFAYDDAALYVALRMEGGGGPGGGGLMTRRDEAGNAEYVTVSLDSYFDRRTAYSFAVTRAGVRLDWYHPDDDETVRDFTFDPVWEARTETQASEWTAEMRIPFSQLRFAEGEGREWGLNVSRVIPARNEQIFWVYVPRTVRGWSSRFGLLTGIDGIQPGRRLEVMPFVASDATVTSRSLIAPGDPFRDDTDVGGRAGADVKVGLGSNLTMDLTFNADFAQVEADPAEVNLSAFETFFAERRPFFTEGSQVLQGNGPGYFYSRRIGSPPPGPARADFVRRPPSSTILGAGKVTGRLANGLSIGALGAVTAREHAETFDMAADRFARVEIAPVTRYGVARLQQEVGDQASTVGVTVTGVSRQFAEEGTLPLLLPERAVAGGVDWRLRFGRATYEVSGHLGFSHVGGDSSAIARLQQSSRHYFQRPDQNHVRFDRSRRGLAGWTGALAVEKRNGRHWLWTAGLEAMSPEFEINDVGQLNRADRILGLANLRYRETTPGRWYRRYEVGLWVEPGWNFGGHRRQVWTSLRSNIQWRNFWSSWLQAWVGPGGVGDNQTRGGPLVHLGKWWFVGGGLSTNPNDAVQGRTSADYWVADPGNGGEQVSVNAGVTLRPAGRWSFSFDTRYQWWNDNRQYVATRPGGPAATFDTRYVFAQVERSQVSAQLRLNYSVTPNLSVESYVEPFAATGRFYDHGELVRDRSFDLRTYGTGGTTLSATPEGTLGVTDGPDAFTLPNLDFRFVSFRSNAVVRWEWNPGSTLFLVWQRDRAASGTDLRLARPDDLLDAWSAPGQNVLTVKLTYWMAVR